MYPGDVPTALRFESCVCCVLFVLLDRVGCVGCVGCVGSLCYISRFDSGEISSLGRWQHSGVTAFGRLQMVILSEMDSVVVPQKRPRERDTGSVNGNGNGNGSTNGGSVNGSTTGSADAEHDPDHDQPETNAGNQSTTAASTNGSGGGAGEEKEHHRKRARLSCNICKARKTKVSWPSLQAVPPSRCRIGPALSLQRVWFG